MKMYHYIIIGAVILIGYITYVCLTPTGNGKKYRKYREVCISSHTETTVSLNPNTNIMETQVNTVCDESAVVEYIEEGYIYHWLFWDYKDFREENRVN